MVITKKSINENRIIVLLLCHKHSISIVPNNAKYYFLSLSIILHSMFSYLFHILQQSGISEISLSTMLIVIILLVISCFLRQIWWLTGYMILYPILIALIWHIYWSVVFWIIMIRIWSSLITTLILKFTFVLEGIKYGLIMYWYVICMILICSIQPQLIHIVFDYNMIVIQIMIIVILQDTVWSVWNISFHTSQNLIHGILIVGLYLLLLQRNWLHRIVILYPDILIWGSLVLIILISKYTGLQFIEVVRFYPLIHHYFYQDNEEE